MKIPLYIERDSNSCSSSCPFLDSLFTAECMLFKTGLSRYTPPGGDMIHHPCSDCDDMYNKACDD